MKKIINGKKYDTETAEFIRSRSNLENGFRNIYEELYRKKTGEYFLYGEGGPMTCYAESMPNSQNGMTGGQAIIPLTEDEAKEWTATHQTVECYEEIFGEVEE